MLNKIAALLLFVFAALLSHANALPEPLESALNQTPEQNPSEWAYTRETRDELGHYVERFDPTKPINQQWQLVKFNDQTPTGKDVERYAKHYDELFKRDNPTEVKLRDAIDPATVKLLAEADDGFRYEFKPRIENDEDKAVVPFLIGTLLVSSDASHVKAMSMKNTKAFKPVKMVKIKHLSVSMEFALVPDHQALVVIRSTSETHGKFMGIKKFSESETVTFSNFEFKGHSN